MSGMFRDPLYLGELTAETIGKIKSGELTVIAGDYFTINGQKFTAMFDGGELHDYYSKHKVYNETSKYPDDTNSGNALSVGTGNPPDAATISASSLSLGALYSYSDRR